MYSTKIAQMVKNIAAKAKSRFVFKHHLDSGEQPVPQDPLVVLYF